MQKLSALFLPAAVFISSQALAGPVLDNINKTNTLHCGYVSYAPALTEDLKTGVWSGFDYDVMKAVSERLMLKVEYTAETGWATIPADLDARKFDMLCSTYWVDPKAAKFMLFSRPVYYQPVFAVARANDNRFDKNMQAINDEKVILVALDGDNPVLIAKTDFPKTKILALPNLTNFSQVLVTVATGKADVTIVDANTFGEYNEHNPGKLKIISPAKPVRIFPASFGFSSHEAPLRDAVDAALNELILDGTIDHIFDKYNKYDHAIYRATVPFRDPYKK